MIPDQAAGERVPKLDSQAFRGDVMQKFLFLLVGQEFEEPRHREQQRLRISVVKVGPGKEVCTDHFQAVATGLGHFPASGPPFRLPSQ